MKKSKNLHFLLIFVLFSLISCENTEGGGSKLSVEYTIEGQIRGDISIIYVGENGKSERFDIESKQVKNIEADTFLNTKSSRSKRTFKFYFDLKEKQEKYVAHRANGSLFH